MPLRCLSQGMRVNIILILYLSFLFCWWSAGVGDLALPSDTNWLVENVHTDLWKNELEMWISLTEGCRLLWEMLQASLAPST